MSTIAANGAPQPELRRSLNLPLLVLYGLGVTIGAGIYVLVGAAAGRAGMYAPVAFLLSAIAIAPTAATYTELACRLPVSAGEAAYAKAGFNSQAMAMLAGWLVILSGVVSSATIAIGSAGYILTFIDVPLPLVAAAVVLVMGLTAGWGILESVLVAAFFTLVETVGLLVLIGAGFASDIEVLVRLPEVMPPVADFGIWFAIANAGLLAVFAYIGFEDMVNVAEETKRPKFTMPWAIFLTLAITTLLYTLVTLVAVLAVPPAELAASTAPLSLVFQKLTGLSPALISAIAVFATMNTILVQFIMASRVVYGMARQQSMPALFARVNPVTRTPLLATAAVVVVTLLLAVSFPLERLAEVTSQFVLAVWFLANLALFVIKWRGDPAPDGAVVLPIWVPVAGLIVSVVFMAVSIVG